METSCGSGAASEQRALEAGFPFTGKRLRRLKRLERERDQPWLRSNIRIQLSPDRMKRLARKASEGGAERRGMYRQTWRCHGRCSKPVWVEFYSRGDRKMFRQKWDPFVEREGPDDVSVPDVRAVRHLTPGLDGPPHDPARNLCPHQVEMSAECRKCPECRKARAERWRGRASVEYLASKRTWMVTLTLTAAMQARCRTEALRLADAAGVRFSDLTLVEQEEAVHKVIYQLVVKWLKRLRKGNKKRGWPPAKFTYSVMFERHKSGEPHLHLLMHEKEAGSLRAQALQANWFEKPYCNGFANAKLVSEKGVSYAMKQLGYVTKEMSARVRASRHYGKPDDAEAARVRREHLRSLDVIHPYDASVEHANDVDLVGNPCDWRDGEADPSVLPPGLGVWAAPRVAVAGGACAPPEQPAGRCSSWEDERIAHWRRRSGAESAGAKCGSG